MQMACSQRLRWLVLIIFFMQAYSLRNRRVLSILARRRSRPPRDGHNFGGGQLDRGIVAMAHGL